MITYKDWYNNIQTFANIINAKYSVKKRPVLGDNYEYYYAEIFKKKLLGKIKIIQSFTEINYDHTGTVSSLLFEYKFKNTKKLYLSFSERDFFDKLFSKQIKTGNPVFDKKYTIKSSDKTLTLNLFSNENIQKYFLSNRLIIFNIQTIKGETIVKLKFMESKLYSIDEMQNGLSFFYKIINLIEQKSV